MTIKEIKEHFIVQYFVEKNSYLLSSITEHGVFPHKYLCTITKIDSKVFKVENYKPTSNIEQFLIDVQNHLNSLEYDSEYYNPLFREGYKYELFLHRLLDKNGFKSHNSYSSSTSNIETYINNNKNVYGGDQPIILNVNTTLDTIRLTLATGDYSGVSVSTAKDFKEIEEGFIGLLKPLFLVNGITNIKKAEELGETTSDIDYVLTELKGLDIRQTNYKTILKNKLIELANSL